jgi:hypothetical protein
VINLKTKEKKMKYLGFEITKEKLKLNDKVWNLYTAKDLYSDPEVVFQNSQKDLIKIKIEYYWKDQVNADGIVPDNILKSLQKKGVI